MEWIITDSNGNRCSVEYFGSRGAASKALASLIDCKNCIDCSGCSGCSRCSRYSGCKKSNKSGVPPVPVIQNIHHAIYAAASQPGELAMGDWHKCEKTHCRAGWVVSLAGKAGQKLEEFYDTALAAMLIYDASDPNYKINPVRFFDDNDAALADMMALAEVQV